MLSSTTATAILAFLATSTLAKDSRTFAVNHFYGNGPLVTARMDPIVQPGGPSGHVHTVQGGSNFAVNMTDTVLLESKCTSSLVKNDFSNYWTPDVYFQDPTNGSFIYVPLFYMNVYYFFEATDDEIVEFQPGHRMVVGNPSLRTPPATGGASILDTAQGTPQPVQFTCPRSNYNTPAWPANSNGMSAGIQDPNNQGAGVGFPDVNCDGYASPLRADIHFPSCYNPAAGIDDYKNNMVFPSSAGTTGGKANCPAGWHHLPHLFYEVYWNTPLFADLWEQGQGKQPFVLSNGDPTGYSLHADFISGWVPGTLQQIIDNCDAGDSGMDKCPGLIGGLNDPSTSCNIQSPIQEEVFGVLDKLPGNNPIVGFGGTVGGGSGSAASAPAAPAATASSSPAAAAASPSASPVSDASSSGSTSSGSTSSGSSSSGSSSSGSSSSGSSSSGSSSSGSSSSGSSSSSSPSSPSSSTTTTTTTNPSPATNNSLTLTSHTYMGCYSDSLNSRVLSGITFADIGIHEVTMTKCVAYCDSKGYKLSGTEYAGQCFCGNELVGSSAVSESQCDMPCEGNAAEICGGSLALSVYQRDSTASKRRRQHARHLAMHLS